MKNQSVSKKYPIGVINQISDDIPYGIKSIMEPWNKKIKKPPIDDCIPSLKSLITLHETEELKEEAKLVADRLSRKILEQIVRDEIALEIALDAARKRDRVFIESAREWYNNGTDRYFYAVQNYATKILYINPKVIDVWGATEFKTSPEVPNMDRVVMLIDREEVPEFLLALID